MFKFIAQKYITYAIIKKKTNITSRNPGQEASTLYIPLELHSRYEYNIKLNLTNN